MEKRRKIGIEEKCEDNKKNIFTNALQGDSIFGSSWNIANGIIGTGVFFLPFLLKDMGILVGFLFLLFGGIILTVAVYILLGALNAARMSKDFKEPPPSLEELVKFGFRESDFLSTFFWLFAKTASVGHGFMNLLAYQIVLIQLLMGVIRILFLSKYDFVSFVDFEKFWARALFSAIIFMGLNIFGLFEKVRSLRIISLVSLLTDVLILVLMILLFFTGFTTNLSSGQVIWFPTYEGHKTIMNFFKYGGKLCFTYMTLSLPKIHSVFKKENLGLLNSSIYNSHTMVFIFYSSVALIGYLSFLDNTNENVLFNYEGESTLAIVISVVLRIMTFFQIFLSYPVWNYVIIVAMDDLSLSIYDASVRIVQLVSKATTKQVVVTTKVTETIVEMDPKDDDDDDDDIISEESTPTLMNSSSEDGLEEGGESTSAESVVVDERSEEEEEDGKKEQKRTEGGGFMTMKFLRFVTISTITNFFVALIAVIYPKAHHVIGYAGGTMGMLYVFVIPTITYIKIKKPGGVVVFILILFTVFTVLMSGVIPTSIMVLNEFGIGV